MRYVKKTDIVDAIGYEDFITYGRMQVGGPPKFFKYKGHDVFMQADGAYTVHNDDSVVVFDRGRVLCLTQKGVAVIYTFEEFESLFTPAE